MGRPSLHLLLSLACCLSPLLAASSDYPVFVAQVPNPNDYSLFANSGWDGNWYVGYNNGWIKKLPPPVSGKYAKAFIGAKLGRMKTLSPEGKPPVFNPVPGEIWMAVASTPAWTAAQRYKLTSTTDIPLDGSPEYALENVGESEWFWTEVPVRSVNLSGDNYLALWSPTPELISVSSSPVLAAAWGGKEVNSWVAKDLTGEPPKNSKTALATGISYFQPALAMKFIPEGNPHPLNVRVVAWQNGTADHPRPVITASVEGDSVERAWVEGGKPWAQIGRPVWKTPFTFSLDPSKLPRGKIWLRLAAVNTWEEKAVSPPFEVEVSPLDPKK